MSTTDLREADDMLHNIIFSDCYRVVLDRTADWDAITICPLARDEAMLSLTIEETDMLIQALQMASREWRALQLQNANVPRGTGD